MENDESEYDDLSRAKTQQTVLIKILEISPEGTRSPTIHELTRSLGKTADSNISRALDELEKKGYIQRDRADSRAAHARGIWLTKRGFDWLTSRGFDTSKYTRVVLIENDIRVVPVFGEIAAGNPRATDGYMPNGYVREYLPLPAQNLPIGQVFVLNVVGDSMMGDGVLDGDQVLVVPYPDPKGNGEMSLLSSMGTQLLSASLVTAKPIGSIRLIQTLSPRIIQRTMTCIFKEEL